jgi:hypothetical protein
MSKIDFNDLVNGVSGKFGRAVFRKRGRQVVLGQSPRKRRNTEPTPAMIAHRERFKRAAAYAKGKMKDPAIKAVYEAQARNSGKEFHTAFAVAVQDFLKPPVLGDLDVEGYKGNIADPITVGVPDDFKIVAVTVTITGSNGALLESGPATFDQTDLIWKYNATVANPALAGTKVQAVGTDRPGNEVTAELLLQ